MTERLKIKETLFAERDYHRKWPLGDFLKTISNIYDSVPEDARKSATLQLGDEWSDTVSSFTIFFDRPETDGEMRRRDEDDKRREREREKTERDLYERLKRKFEGE